MSRQRFFITGTDTDVGKTLCTAALLHKAKLASKSTLGLKPLAAGCEETEQGLRNSDALALMAQSTEQLPYEQVNPVALKEAIAPHIAAERLNKPLSAARLVGYLRGVLMINRAEFICIEGAGGWRVPLNAKETLAEVPKDLKLPVILVVGMKLGCINHAMLTMEAIHRDGLNVVGWIANLIDNDMDAYQENLDSLKKQIRVPCLGELPYLTDPSVEAVAQYLTLPEG
ncbi:dethiobiotin synthase [Bermanella sp. 47_1433_sub80_T6]|nr:dethiobiotin synthase [Bermanella sp. 47_1433_sub80_T6]